MRIGGGFWRGVVFGMVFGFGFILAEFLGIFWGAEIGEAFFEEIADGGFDLFFDAAVFVGGGAVRNWGMGFGDAPEIFFRGGLMAEGVDLVAEDHELALERLELLVDVVVRALGGGQAGAMGAAGDGGESL